MRPLRDIPEFPGYRISEAGDVWCFNPPHEPMRGHWCKPFRHNDGVSVRLVKNGMHYNRRPSVLLKQTWLAPRPKLPWPPRPDPIEAPGLFSTGSANTHAKLDEEAVLRMRRLRVVDPRRWTYSALAAEFSVSRGTVFHALGGLTWTHVEMPAATSKRCALGRNAKLTRGVIAEAKALRATDPKRWTLDALAARYGVEYHCLNRHLLGIRHSKSGPTRKKLAELLALRAAEPRRWTHAALAAHFGVSGSSIYRWHKLALAAAAATDREANDGQRVE